MANQYRVKTGVKLYTQVLEQVKSMIAQGVYQKGDLLPSEKELIEMMGVSRITVRKALQILGEAGVIETRKGKGSFVAVDASELAPASMDLKKYCESFVQAAQARLLLEPAIARQAAQTATPEELEQLRKNVHTALPMDHFHDVLVEMVHNPLVTDWIQQSHRLETDPTLSALIPPARQRSMSPQLEAQHQKIYEAIRDHKSEHAYFYMKEHLEFVLESYQEYFAMFY